MASYKKTSLSGGELVRAVLMASPDIAGRITQIFPVVTDTADLPYICYRRSSMVTVPMKGHTISTDTVAIEIMVCASTYDEGVELAEHVRAALDCKSIEATDGTLQARACTLADASESYEADAFIQLLKFNIKIQ